jgi:hypothetical protein
MQQFIQQAMQALGTPEDATTAATSGLLRFLDQNGPKAEVAQLLDALPGARDLIALATPAAATTNGGMAAGLGGALSALGGLGSGGAAGLLGAIQQSGLSMGAAPQLVSLFVGFAKTKAGPDLVGRVTSAVPGLLG